MKKLAPILAFLILLVPLWIVLFVGYPIILNDPSSKQLFPGKTNRCFKLGDTNLLMKCFKDANPKVRGRFLLVYFHEFRYLLVISGLMLGLCTYCGVWLVFKQNSES